MKKRIEKDMWKDVLGLPYELNCFLDGVKRTVTPVKMSKFPKLVEAFTQVNVEKLWANFVWGNSAEKITEILELSFVDYGIEEILDNINAGNFDEIINAIQVINGLDFLNKEETEGNAQMEV